MMYVLVLQEMEHATLRKSKDNSLDNWLKTEHLGLEPRVVPLSEHMDPRSSIYVTVILFREECSNKGGNNDGNCASGFGVCCTCTYVSQGRGVLLCIKDLTSYLLSTFFYSYLGMWFLLPESIPHNIFFILVDQS